MLLEQRCIAIRQQLKEYGLRMQWLVKRLNQQGIPCSCKSATNILLEARDVGMKTSCLVSTAEQILNQYASLWE